MAKKAWYDPKVNVQLDGVTFQPPQNEWVESCEGEHGLLKIRLLGLVAGEAYSRVVYLSPRSFDRVDVRRL